MNALELHDQPVVMGGIWCGARRHRPDADLAKQGWTLDWDDFSSKGHPNLAFLFEHDRFGKPVTTFPDHALGTSHHNRRTTTMKTGLFDLSGKVAIVTGGNG